MKKLFLQLKKKGGFSLIELMITVAIIGILAAIAIPSYRQYVIRSERTQAISTLMELDNWMHRRYTILSSYDGLLVPDHLKQSPANGSAKYNLAITNKTETEFIITATPVNTEDKCGVFSIDQSGKKMISKGQIGDQLTADCWGGR